MFIETITSSRDDYEHWNERLNMLDDPPPGLVASVAWNAGDGEVTVVNVWETPAAVGDFYMARVRHIVESGGEPEHKPARRGPPVHFWMRGD
jgi:hypothetical protein